MRVESAGLWGQWGYRRDMLWKKQACGDSWGYRRAH